MKKLVFFAFIFIILYVSIQAKETKESMLPEPTYQVIPDEAIRLRILANSDDEEDQQVKHVVRDEINAQISTWVENISDIDEARQLIQTRLPEISEKAKQAAKEYDISPDEINVDYDENVTFPVKLYGSYLYPAGEYEAILVTIGEGKGANWWCVLFPPLCFLDFSNGTFVADEVNDESPEEETPVKIDFFLFKWFGWT